MNKIIKHEDDFLPLKDHTGVLSEVDSRDAKNFSKLFKAYIE